MLGGLCCLDDRLPQGAPTSPALSNIVCRRLDARIAGFCRACDCRFTRYADDIAISGNPDVPQVLNFVREALAESGFQLNETKTRVLSSHQRQIVTGVV